MKNHTKVFSLWHFIRNFGAKPLHIRFDEIDGFIRAYGGSRYLVLFGCEKYDLMSNRIIYLIGVKSGILSFLIIMQKIVVLADCIIFLAPFLGVTRMSMHH